MLLALSPLTYLFLCLYSCLTLGLLFSTSSLFVLWIFMELQIIIFLVVSLPHFRYRHSSLILYFLIQSVCSLIVLGFSFYNSFLLLVALVVKLGVFPFYGWYLSSLPSFPSLPLFLGLTFQKLPSVLLLNMFFGEVSSGVIYLVVVFSFLGGLASLSSVFSVRVLLVWSSLVTNLWFLLSLGHSLSCFLVYFSVYGVLVLLFIIFSSLGSSYLSGSLIVLLFSLGGFPPFPLFFINLLVLYYVAVYSSPLLVLLVLFSSVITMYIYCSVSLSLFINNYSNV